jgi:putative ABC transport system ATP-binding protein
VPDRNLAVAAVSVSFGPARARVRALSDVSISFTPGELTLVTGPSGSGKTTLLSLLGCLLTPDEGKVFVNGSEVSRVSAREQTRLRGRIGFIFQAFRLFHSLPALENVMVAADISGGRSHRAERARRLLVDLGLGDKLGLKPDALSGGEKQRVAIARALLSEPGIVLADEPTASLDFQAGQQIREILSKLASEQARTVVVVSHDDRWNKYANRTVVLEDGCVVDDRRNMTCEKLLSEYSPA